MCAFCNAHPLLRLGGDESGPTPKPEPALVVADDGDMPSALNDDIGDDINTTTTLPIGASITSSIQHGGDLDYFRVQLEAGRTYTFHMEGLGLRDPLVELRDAGGALVAENDDGGIGVNAFLVFRAETSGTYYIVARAYQNPGPVDTGLYRLTSAEIPRGSTSPTPIAETPARPAFSWDEAAIQISRDGHSWSSQFELNAVVTYGFRSTAPSTLPTDVSAFQRFNQSQIEAAEQALRMWAEVANITFVRVGEGSSGEGAYTNNAAILFSSYTTTADTNTSGFAYLPSTGNQSANSVQGDVWINVGFASNQDPVTNPNGMRTLVHEIGHAIGLRHPGDYDGGTPLYSTHATYAQDSVQYTSMSYFAASATGGSATAWSQMPHMHDIAAVQRLYGANLGTRTGDTVYGFNNNTGNILFGPSVSNSMYFTIWDAGGHDTLNLSGYSTPSFIDLREEAFSSAGPVVQTGGLAQWNIAIARGVVIEDAIGGSGNDTLIGNQVANALRGGAGDDLFIVLGHHFVAGDFIDGGSGFDTIRSMGSVVDYRVGTVLSIERMAFQQLAGEATITAVINSTQIGAGGLSPNLVVSGSAAQDAVQIFVGLNQTVDISGWMFDFPAWSFEDYVVYVGDAGNETFIGFQGMDVFFGSPGNDIFDGRGAFDFAAYIFSPFAVTADLAIVGPQAIGGNQGFDTFINLEGLAGSQLDDILYGDHQDNILMGMWGNDILIGRGGNDDIRGYEGSDIIEGGMGADILWGGAEVMAGPDGADIFRYRNAAEGGDTIMDFQSGIDRIEVSAAGFGGGLVVGGAVNLVANANPVASGGGGQFLYNTTTGQLSWDADGAGAGAAVLIATLRGAPALTQASFIVSGISGASLLGGDQDETMSALPAGKDAEVMATLPPDIMVDSFSFDMIAARTGAWAETLPPDLAGGADVFDFGLMARLADKAGVAVEVLPPDLAGVQAAGDISGAMGDGAGGASAHLLADLLIGDVLMFDAQSSDAMLRLLGEDVFVV